MCNNYLEQRAIRLKVDAADRDDAIRQAALPLIEAGKIKEGYVTQMIEAVEELGPYMVLMPGVALAHGRPSDNVVEDCLGLMTLREPVVFGHPANDPVHIIFVLAAKEAGCHLEALKDISRLLVNQTFIETLKAAEKVEELLGYFK